MSVKNAPTGGSSSGGLGGSFNRDPKATQVKRIGYQISNGSGGSGRDNFEGPEADFSLIKTAIKRDSYLTQTVMKFEELIFKSGWTFQGKNDQSLEYLRLRFAMMAIATGTPTEVLFHGVATDIVRYSNSFIAKARGKGGVGLPPGVTALAMPPSKDPVVGYFRLPPETITIARDQNGTVLNYQQTVQGADDPITFKPEDMIHIKVNVPPGSAFGDPWLAPVLEDIRLLRKVEENAALLLYRHIFPLLTYKIGIADKPETWASDEEIEEFRAIIEDMPTDGAIVLPERHSVEAVNINAIDGKPYLDYFENRVFSGLGLSSVDFGRGDTANRNTADAMTGTKADRVKGWHQQIQTQIDKYMIEEILVEGSFDPLVNPEFDVDFIFNETEHERIIAKETHEIFKFNNNVQTWEETRTAIGKDPVGDEARLHYQMIGMQTAEHAASLAPQTAAGGSSSTKPSGEAGNKNQPANQHGKRSAPKKATEGIHERYFQEKHKPTAYTYLANSVNDQAIELNENVFERMSVQRMENLNVDLESIYREVEADTMDTVLIQVKEYPVENAKTLLSSVHFAKDKMTKVLMNSAALSFEEGMTKAREAAGRSLNPKFNQELAKQTIKSFIQEHFDTLEERIQSLTSSRLSEVKTQQESLLAVKGIFESLRFKVREYSKTALARSYNYGYALALMNYGEEAAKVHYEGTCPNCQQRSQELLTIKQISSLDEVSIFYKIPPWHPNCNCEMTLEGGEN